MPITQTTIVPLDLKLRAEKGLPLTHDEMDKNFLMLMLLPFVYDNCDNFENANTIVNKLVSSVSSSLLSDGSHSLFVDGSVLVVPLHALVDFSLVSSVSYNCIILDYDLKLLKNHPYYLDVNTITLDSHSLTDSYFLVVEFASSIVEDVTLTISNPA